MKAVQIGILVALVVVAGLLYRIWRGQQPEPAATPPAETQTTTAAPAATPTPPASTSQPPEKEEAPKRPSPAPRSRPRSEPAAAETRPPVESPQAAAPATEPSPANPPAAAPVPSTVPAESPAPPQPRTVTIAAGTLLSVRLSESLSSERNQPQDNFTATFSEPLIVEGFVVAERGARAHGRVVESQRAGQVKGVSSLAIQLVRLETSDGQSVDIQTDVFKKEGPTTKGEDATKVGAAAGLGAAIGAIAGGGKGAAIGAAIGGAAGAGTVMGSRGKQAVLPSETRISFRLREPVTLTEKLK